MRVLLSLAALFDLWIIHIDAKTVFLNDKSDVELYVHQPEGFVDRRYPNHVLRLSKSLYGLKQAPRIWYLLLCETILSLGFIQCTSDPSIYFHPEYKVVLAVYVDDILVLGKTREICDQFYNEISQHFCIEYKGPVTHFSVSILCEMNQGSQSIKSGILNICWHGQMDKAKPVEIPLNPSLPLLKAKSGDKRMDIQSYQEFTGSHNHATVFSRLDISFAVSKLSQFNSDPTETHMKAAHQLLTYLKGTINYSIVYGDASDAEIYAYTRAIHPDDYLSILGFSDFRPTSQPPLLYSDSTTALFLTDESSLYQRSKHIDTRYHYIRDILEKQKFSLSQVDYVCTFRGEPADIFTKALSAD